MENALSPKPTRFDWLDLERESAPIVTDAEKTTKKRKRNNSSVTLKWAFPLALLFDRTPPETRRDCPNQGRKMGDRGGKRRTITARPD